MATTRNGFSIQELYAKILERSLSPEQGLQELLSLGMNPEDANRELQNLLAQAATATPSFIAAVRGGPLTATEYVTGSDGSVRAKPTSPRSGGITESEVYDKYNKGGYGTVGSQAAKNAALADLAQYFKNTGMTAEEAAGRAGRSFDAVVGAGGALDAIMGGGGTGAGTGTGTRTETGTGAGTGIGTGTGGGGMVGGQFGTQRDKWLELERTPGGRADLWGEAIRSQYPGASNPFQDFLGRQEDAAFNQYMLQSASGPSHAGDTPINTFRDYARGGGSGGGQRLSQSQMADMLGQWGSALGNPDTSGLSKAMLNWLPFMRQGANQFNTALQSSVGGVPGAARPYFENAAGESFADYGVNNPETGGWLNQWLNRGRRFF